MLVERLARALTGLLDSFRTARAPHDPRIAEALAELASRAGQARPADGFARYLSDRPALARLEVTRDWYQEGQGGELRLEYTSSLFAPGRLRLKPLPDNGATVVFLHGSVGSAAESLGEEPGLTTFAPIAEQAGCGFACWDWPVHGQRRTNALYHGLRSPQANEREYARVLAALGTSLWREWLAELAFALEQLRRQLGRRQRLHVVGNSMGAGFAYAAPLLGVDVSSVVAINSCARVADLLAEGAGRAHGFFFYPLDGLRYFDLEDLVRATRLRGVRLLILHGSGDGGSLESTRRRLRESGAAIEVLPDHGHLFSDAIKSRVLEFLRELESGDDADP